MKYLVDAQISFKIAKLLIGKGFDVIHTNSLANKDFTSDQEIREISMK